MVLVGGGTGGSQGMVLVGEAVGDKGGSGCGGRSRRFGRSGGEVDLLKTEEENVLIKVY